MALETSTMIRRAEDVNLTDPAEYIAGQPIAVLNELRERHGIYWHGLPEGNPYGHPGFWSILKHEDVSAISLKPEIFSSEKKGNNLWDHPPMLDGALIAVDPPRHKRLRGFVNPNFGPTSVRGIEDWITELVIELLEPVIANGETEFVSEVAAKIPTRTFCKMMDVPQKESKRLIQWIDEFSAASANPGPRMIEILQDISDYGNLLADSRKGHTGNDVVSAMMRASHDDGPLSRVEFGSLFLTIATGASETMRSLLSHTMLTLAQRPDLYADLRANPDIVPTAVEEFLRWGTPLNYFRRTVTQDTVFQGIAMKEGDVVVIWYLSANFDPAVFDNPNELNLRRKPNRQISFGIGEHFCLGARVARSQMQIFLQELVKRVQRIELAGEVTRIAQPLANLYGQLPLRLIGA